MNQTGYTTLSEINDILAESARRVLGLPLNKAEALRRERAAIVGTRCPSVKNHPSFKRRPKK